MDSEAGPFHRPRPEMWQRSPSRGDDLTSCIHTSHFFLLILTKSDLPSGVKSDQPCFKMPRCCYELNMGI